MVNASDVGVGPSRRRRSVLAASGALILVVVVLAGVLLISSSGAETERRNVRTSAGSQVHGASSTHTGPTEFLLVCATPISNDHGIETSSSVVSRVPEGTAIPAGCHRG